MNITPNINPINNQFTKVLSRTWWLLLLRGLIAIAFGVMIWLQPEMSIVALVLIFGVYALADGALGVWTAIAGRKEHEDWWILLIWGGIGVAIGILTFMAPGATALALLFYIAVWAIATGVLQIVSAIRLRKEIEGEWLLVFGGFVSVVFGILLMAQPVTGVLALLWLIALYGVVFGISLVILAFKVRKSSK